MHQKLGLFKHHRICGGCGVMIEGISEGDVWIPTLGSIPLCSVCMTLMRTALPVLDLTIKMKLDELKKQREQWGEATAEYKPLPKRKFILLTRPKEGNDDA